MSEGNEAEETYLLGFLEEATQGTRLTSMFFPSKVGGHPAWLDPINIPSPDSLKCVKCTKPMAFLLQLYAPFEEFEYSFHRTVFIFCCKDDKCNTDASVFRAYRSQLPLVNPFYPDKPVEVASETVVEDLTVSIRKQQGIHLCPVCGCRATFLCGRCKSVRYCSAEHQRYDWSNGHKASCVQGQSLQPSTRTPTSTKNPFVFVEFEVVTEPEEQSSDSDAELNSADEDVPQNYQESAPQMTEEEEQELEETAAQLGEGRKDKVFDRFQKIISANPEQCIRYGRFTDARPVWVCANDRLDEKDIPVCSRCNSPRQFEFQILPQLLYFLQKGEENAERMLDWGTVVVYSCSKSCETSGYADEFVWRQNIPEKETNAAE